MVEAIVFIIGLFFGSFFGVLVDRIPKGKNIVTGRSKCEYCKKEIAWYDLIPVLSFIILKGRCRNCQKNLSVYYPLIEILTGLFFLFVFIYFYPLGIIYFLLNLIVLSSLFVLFFMDLKYGILADKIVFPSTIITFIYYAFFKNQGFTNHLLSAIFTFLFFFAISYGFYIFTKKDGMGGGDIKLSFLLGAFLGFPKIVISLYIAFLTGAIISIILILWKKKRFQKDSVPFGPFLILGGFISLIWGDQILTIALKLLGF